MIQHQFSSYILDPIPPKHWREGTTPLHGTKLGFCQTCGFTHVDPYPTEEYLAAYYKTYTMPVSQTNAAEISRFIAKHLPTSAHIVDVGCGDGLILEALHQQGFRNLTGLDEGPATATAEGRKIAKIERQNLWTFLEKVEASHERIPDAFVLINVLEHIREPFEFLKRVRTPLKNQSRLVLLVPNDFSSLQEAYLKAKKQSPWFVALPDHLNYFNLESLSRLATQTGYKVRDVTATYPLELFLLQDLDYVSNPDLGPQAHQRRIQFEEQLRATGHEDTLDAFYSVLGKGGFGRNLMVILE